MSETKTTYTHDDVMQALCCLARFQHLDADEVAADVLKAYEAGEQGKWGFVYGDGKNALLFLGPSDVRVSMGALRLMAKANAERQSRARLIKTIGGLSRYDLHLPRERRTARERHAGGTPRG